MSETRKIVYVAGAGRSGTSTMSGILTILGLQVPQPEVVADESNPKGFGEPQWVVDFHERLLGEAVVTSADGRPSAWAEAAAVADRPAERTAAAAWLGEHFEVAPELVVKDPRISYFLDLWREAATANSAEPLFVTMLRPPAEVVGSRQKYYKSRLGAAHLTASWLNMLLHTELATRGTARSFVRYADLLGDWRSAVSTVGTSLKLSTLAGISDSAAARIDGFVDPSLRRVTLDWDDLELPPRLLDLTRTGWEQLNLLASPEGDTAEVHGVLDEVRASYTELYDEAEAISKSVVVAATTRARREALAEHPAPSGDGSIGAPASRRAVDRIPHDLRARIPAPVRRAARRVLKHR
ncbi:sulfotransferase family protein [Nocardioides speluncae]|uniref:sulfotransferase family protein n=1 Tax=Nocardioides speluncae TaxID=2670337 RepID=UPI001F0C496C|nr:sulfotransferase family protein [Nocardioides speluncae]